MKRLQVVALFVLAAVCMFACGTGSGPISDDAVVQNPSRPMAVQPVSPLAAGGAPTADYLITPNGYFHKSCVHEVPSGAHADDQDNVTVNGAVTHYPPCQYTVFSNTLQGAQPIPTKNGQPPSIGHAWVESDEQDQNNGIGFNGMYEDIAVPYIPLVDGFVVPQIIYFFPALQPAGQGSFPLMQPVLSFGNNNDYGNGWDWFLAAWWLTSSNNSYYSTPGAVNPNDAIDADMQVVGTYESGGIDYRTWLIQGWDMTSNFLTYAYFNTSADYQTVSPAVLEVYNVTTCNDYPNQLETHFTDIHLFVPANNSWTDLGAATLAPFEHQAPSNTTPWCDYSVADFPGLQQAALRYQY